MIVEHLPNASGLSYDGRMQPNIPANIPIPLTSLPTFIVRKLLNPVTAGFPSPAADYEEKPLDLVKFCIKHPAATFVFEVEGECMTKAGIMHGSNLIVDRAEVSNVKSGDIVLALIHSEFTVKRIQWRGNEVWLCPDSYDPIYQPILITEEMGFEVWAKVMKVIHDPNG